MTDLSHRPDPQQGRPGELEPWDRIETLLNQDDAGGIEALLRTLPPGEAARAISRLDEANRGRLLALLPPDHAADLLEELSDTQAADLLGDLSPAQAAVIVTEMPSHDQVDLLGELEPEEAAAILDRMPPDEARHVRELSRYAPDTAGGLMVTEYLGYSTGLTVSDVIDDLRANAARYSGFDIQYAYVTSPTGVLVGVLGLRDLLLAGRDAPVASIMRADPIQVRTAAPIDELEQMFRRHAFVGVPVVDREHRLMGVVRRQEVAEAREERADSTFLKSSGIVGGEEIRTMPLLVRSSRRLAWLSINIVLNVLAASVIALYQDTLAAVIALAVFLPIISDMSGCSGNQAVAVSLRELTLGLVRPYELLRVLAKEAEVGVINGLALGVLLGAVAWVWKGNPYLGLVAGGALAVNTVVAVAFGGMVPLVLRRFNLDPALASGPVLTTVTDMCGFFFVLSFATAALARLV